MKTYFVLTLILVCFLIFSSEVLASNSNKLKINGTVISSEVLYGHIYNEDEVNPYLLIVRVDEILKGEIDSKYILVNYYWRLKDDYTVATTKFSKWELQLYKQKSCDSSIGKLQFVMFGRDQPSGMMPRFNRTWGIPSEKLPFDETLPCYRLKRDEFSPVKSSIIANAKMPETDTEYYVLEKTRWINFPAAPLEFGLLRNGNLFLQNKSEKQIESYKLGCVTEDKDNHLKTVVEISEVKYKIKPKGEKWSINSIGTDEYLTEFKTCYDKNAKLSVIEVHFDDNFVWRND
ncbi:MAG TPA: hypothetical protein VNB22_11445 [Pyrinomonadaceae bacterium]|nr:hypothetical protein [Pyrinomonadaceae bacterium]